MSIPIRNADRSHVIGSERMFFVTSSTWGKTGLLQSARADSLLIDVLYHYREEQKYLLRICDHARSFPRADHGEPGDDR